MSPIRAVFFDLDETLLDDERTSREASSRTAGWASRHHPELQPDTLDAAYHHANLAFWKSYDQATEERTGQEIRRDMWLAALRACGVEDLAMADDLAVRFMEYRWETYAFFPDAEPCLEALHGRYHLGLITNGATYIQCHKAEALKLDRWMDVIVVAEMVSSSKPDAGIFEYALNHIGCRAEESVMVGDLLDRDILGARNAGMIPVWIDRPPLDAMEQAIARVNRLSGIEPPEHTIASLAELPPLLQRLSAR